MPVVLMHAQGDPQTMQDAPATTTCSLDVFDYLEARVDALRARRHPPSAHRSLDPGIGFGKTLTHNLALMSGLRLFHGLGVPLLLGASRKRFIGTLTGVEAGAERVAGSIGAALAAAAQGAQIIRVHDVRATREAIAVWVAATSGVAPKA